MPISHFEAKSVDESCNPAVSLVPSSYDPATCKCFLLVGADGSKNPVLENCTSCKRVVRCIAYMRNRTEHKREYFHPDGSLARRLTFAKRISFDSKTHRPKGYELTIQEDTNKAYTDAMHVTEWSTPAWTGWKEYTLEQVPAGMTIPEGLVAHLNGVPA
jgi:hypothetical protein